MMEPFHKHGKNDFKFFKSVYISILQYLLYVATICIIIKWIKNIINLTAIIIVVYFFVENIIYCPLSTFSVTIIGAMKITELNDHSKTTISNDVKQKCFTSRSRSQSDSELVLQFAKCCMW